MADPSTGITDLSQALASLSDDDVRSLLTKFEDSFRKMGITLGDLESKAASAGKGLKNAFGDAFEAAKGDVEGLKKKLDDLFQDGIINNLDPSLRPFTTWANRIKSGFESIEDTSVGSLGIIGAKWLGLGAALSKLPEPRIAQAFHKEATDITADTSYIQDFLGSLDIKNESIKHLIEFSNASFKAVDSVNKMESALISTASKSGQFNSLLEATGDDFDRLDDVILAFSDEMADVGNATGLTAGQVSVLGLQLSKIPGSIAGGHLNTSLEQMTDLTAENGDRMNELTAAITLASGTGQNGADVIEQLTKQYMLFGTTGEDALTMVSDLSSASKDLGLPLDLVTEGTSRTTEALKFFGNTTESTLKVLGRFAPALRNLGLGPQAIQEMTSAITQNVAAMNLASESFLSRSTGGPGGLRGGFQIELLKSQGRLDDLEKLVEKSLLSQFGGKIVTLEEATKSEGAARQLTKQVQLVTQGPTKIVENEAQAYKLFEAMSKGMLGGTELNLGTKGLEENVARGTDIQNKQYNSLVQLNNQMERLIAIQNVKVKEVAQEGMNVVSGLIAPNDIGPEAQKQSAVGEASNTPVYGTTPELPALQDVDQKMDGIWEGIKSGITDVFNGNILNTVLGGLEVAPPQIPTVPGSTTQVSINTVCPICHAKEHKTTLAMMDGKMQEVEKQRNTSNLTGTTAIYG